MKKIELPGFDVPFVLSNGLVNPDWYSKLKLISDALNAGVLGAIDVDNSTPITNGQVLVYDSTANKLKPGAN